MKFGKDRNGQRAGRGKQEIPSSFSWPSVLHTKLENANTPPPPLFLSHATPPTLTSLFLRSFFWCTAVSMCAQHAHHRQHRPEDFKSSGRWRVYSSTLFAVGERCQHMPAMQMCSYLMSSSKSHSDWCLKCSLVICSVCVFFSSCVTLTWREQKVKDWCLIHAKPDIIQDFGYHHSNKILSFPDYKRVQWTMPLPASKSKFVSLPQ